jgi:glycine dehydrogenase subunit 2
VKEIVEESKRDAEMVKKAPPDTRTARLDEARAARKPVLRWSPSHEQAHSGRMTAPAPTHSTEG